MAVITSPRSVADPDGPPAPEPSAAPPSPPRRLRYHRAGAGRPRSAAQVMGAGLVAFLVGGLLNAEGLSDLADRQPFGWKRDVARTAVAPLLWVSHTTGLDRPRNGLERVIGREDETDDGTTGGGGHVRFLPPPVTVPRDEREVLLRRPTPAAPLRVWVGGDSMTQVFGESFVTAGQDRGDVEPDLDFRISTGLNRPDYFDWPRHLVDDVLTGSPEVVVIMFGANDGQPIELDDGVHPVRSEAWQDEYARRVGATMDLLAGDGRLTIWVGQPNMRDDDFDERMTILNRIYRAEAAGRPWIRFVDSRDVVSPDGYSPAVRNRSGDEVVVRQADGIHLTRKGGDRVAAAVMRAIDRAVDEALADGRVRRGQ